MSASCLHSLLALALVTLLHAADAPERPWEGWEPPSIEMPDPNAFDIYQEAFRLIDQIGEPDPNADVDALAEHLESHRATFRLLQTALMGDCRPPAVTSAGQPFPYLADFRRAARLLAARSRVMREYGMYLESALDAVDAIRMGNDAAGQRSLISHLVSVAVGSIGLAALEETLPFLTAAESLVVLNALRAARAESVPMAEMLEGELAFSRLMFRDLMTRVPNAESLYDAELDTLVEGLPQTWSPWRSWDAIGELFESWIKQTSVDAWLAPAEVETKDPFAKLLAPAFEVAFLRGHQAEARMALTITAIACHVWWVENGAPPDSLEELTPGYLPSVPMDPFSGKSLLGPVDATGLVIYSVGPDGVDHAGQAIEGPAKQDSVGDITMQLQEPLVEQ